MFLHNYLLTCEISTVRTLVLIQKTDYNQIPCTVRLAWTRTDPRGFLAIQMYTPESPSRTGITLINRNTAYYINFRCHKELIFNLQYFVEIFTDINTDQTKHACRKILRDSTNKVDPKDVTEEPSCQAKPYASEL